MPSDEWTAQQERERQLEALERERAAWREVIDGYQARIATLEGALERLREMADAPGWDWRSAKPVIRTIVDEALASTPQPQSDKSEG